MNIKFYLIGLLAFSCSQFKLTCFGLRKWCHAGGWHDQQRG